MAYVTVPKDLTKVKSKVVFGLTKRQLICFGGALLAGVPLFFLIRGRVPTSAAALIMVFAMLPGFLLALYEKHGQPLEVVVRQIVEMGEYNRFSKGIFGWIGFKTYWLPYENVNRVAGETKWSFWKLFRYAIDGVINFSQAPLSVASWFGMFMTFVSFIAVVFIIIRKLIFGDPVDGWASTVCIITLIGGIQLFCMGIMGQYIAKTYLEVKKRPHYIVSDTNREDMEKVK